MAVERFSDPCHGGASVVHSDLRNIHLNKVLYDQCNTAVFHSFPCVVMRVKPGADDAEEKARISLVPAG